MKYFLIITLTIFCFYSCKQEKTQQSAISNNKPSESINYTQSELSIADGGKWEGREYKNRTSFKNIASLKVPSQHTDHSYFLRYEGPGWESDKIGYRLYLDWRNAIDVFGKKTTENILSNVGQDGFDSYHKMNDWGMDILKVDKSLGIGSYGRLLQDSVHHFPEVDSTYVELENRSNSSHVKIDYWGWKTNDIVSNLKADFTISQGSNLTQVKLSNFSTAEGIVTGIVKHPNTELIKGSKPTSKWNYIATYGNQSLVPDQLGLVIFYKNNDAIRILNGKYDHLIEFHPKLNNIEYYFGAVWMQGNNQIHTKHEFEKFISKTLNEI